MLSKKEKREIKFATKAMDDVVGQWYADGYITQKQIDRLIKWGFKLLKIAEDK